MADIPGIIENAHLGKGLGTRFLRHIERNSMLLFLIPCDSEDITKEYQILLNELGQYNPELLDKPRLLAITKIDIADAEWTSLIEPELPKDLPHIFISAAAHKGIEELKDMIWKKLQE
jgi:GTP-binding protein